MMQRFFATLVFLFFAVTIGAVPIFAQQATPTQQPTPTPGVPLPTPISDLERRVSVLESQQNQTIETLKSSNEYNRFLITGIGTIVAALVVIQGFLQGFTIRNQGRREREHDQRQAQREEQRDLIEREHDQRQSQREQQRDVIEQRGADQVSNIMTVVEKTLASRLAAEQEARDEATKAHAQLERVLSQFGTVEQFYQKYQATIKSERQATEEAASRLAVVSRHDFRRKTNELDNFAKQFDRFKFDFQSLEEPPAKFSARVPYIRGIAAHYANQPEITKQYLKEVTGSPQSELGEPDIAYRRRVANAYFYLGLTESNFGNHLGAIDVFEEAIRLDPEGSDFLTKVVTAEAYIMSNNFDNAKQFIVEIEDGVRRIEREKGRLQSFHMRLRSRAALIRANMALLRREANWRDEAQQLLDPVHDTDPQYYFAIATLAQVHTGQGDPGKSQKLFREVYEIIEHSGDLLTVTEARSRILLLMVAGMCCKHGLMDEKRSDEYLDTAVDLCNSLPRIGQQFCTVFSTISKRNEDKETIYRHINSIRKGNVLVEPDE